MGTQSITIIKRVVYVQMINLYIFFYKILLQWRTYIVEFWMRSPRVQILSISCSFREILQNRMLVPPEGLAPPPQGNSGSGTVLYSDTIHRNKDFSGMTQNNWMLCKGRQYLLDNILKFINQIELFIYNCLLARIIARTNWKYWEGGMGASSL